MKYHCENLSFCNLMLGEQRWKHIAQQIFSGTENKFIVWNYCFLGPTSIYLFEFSNIINRIKCEIFKVNSRNSRCRSGVSITKFWICLTRCSSVFSLKIWIADGILYCLKLNWSMHFRVRSKSPLILKTKLHVTAICSISDVA